MGSLGAHKQEAANHLGSRGGGLQGGGDTGLEGSRLRASTEQRLCWDPEVTHPAEPLGPDMDRSMTLLLGPYLIEVSSLSPEVECP